MADDGEYQAALKKLSAGQVAAAVKALTRVAAEQPERARVHSNLGYALAKAERHKEARKAAERGHELAPDDVYTRWMLASVAGDADDHEVAIEHAQAVLESPEAEPFLGEAELLVGWSQLQLGRWREAVGTAREAIERVGDRTEPWILLSAALAEGHWWGAAMAAIRRAVAEDPDDDDASERLQATAEGLSTVESLLQEIKEDVEADGSRWEVWHELGRVLGMCGRVPDALAAFDRARTLHPDPTYRDPDAPAMLSPYEADCRLGLADVGVS